MVSRLKKLWNAGGRRWRLEGRDDRPVGSPRLRIPGVAAEAGPRGSRILFINQYYWPDNASTAQHLTDLAESLAARGHDCRVLCSRGGYRPGADRPPAFEVRNGVEIHRVGATSFGRLTTPARLSDYLSFYAAAAARVFTLPRFDLAITLTTPPLIGLVGMLLRKLRRTRHVVWSMDLHPECSVALGRMSAGNPIVSALRALSDAVYKDADKVVVLGPYMADRVAAKGVRPDRLATIPVWSRRDEVYPLDRRGHPLREELGLVDKFVAMYSGNLGLAHAFDEFLEAARRLRDRDDLVFLFVGEGPRLAEVREAKRREGLNNVRLLDYFPRDRLFASLSLADAHLISLRSPMTGLVVPGKLYGAMASGRPTLFLGPEHCETADAIREAGCGATVRTGDVDGLVEALSALADDPERARLEGERARSAFLGAFDKDGCCDRWAELIGGQVVAPVARLADTDLAPPSPANSRVAPASP